MNNKKPDNTYSRNYSKTTLKILFGMSGNECAEPDCANRVILKKTEFDGEAVSAQIAHIYAVSDDGPRGKPGLTQEERNHHNNLLLLCPTHHVTVDKQHQTYPASLLQKWKSDHERKYSEQTTAHINEIGYAELEFAAKAVMSTGASSEEQLTPPLAPQDKIHKNGLSDESAFLIKVGASKSHEVESVIQSSAQLDPAFPSRLSEGFKAKYAEFIEQGMSGDDLFDALYIWAGGGYSNPKRQCAGLCVLTHLFILCDVFES